MEKCPACLHHKHTPRSEEEIRALKNRLNRIVGQVNGVSKMIDENRICSDVLVQIASIERAIQQVGYLVLEQHLKTCVSDDIKNNDYSSLDEAIDLIKRIK